MNHRPQEEGGKPETLHSVNNNARNAIGVLGGGGGGAGRGGVGGGAGGEWVNADAETVDPKQTLNPDSI